MNQYDILLIIAPPWGVRTPPIGVSFLAAYLKKHDIKVKIFDVNIYLYNRLKSKKADLWHPGNKLFWVMPEEFNNIRQTFKGEIDRVIQKILSVKTEIIGFSVFSDNRLFSIELIKRIKEAAKEKKIIVGGVGCFTEEERKFFPNNIVDAFVIGEGEQSLLHILRVYKDGLKKKVKKVMAEQCPYFFQEPLRNLDQIPFPTYEDVDISEYTDESLSLSFGRGCPMQCRYCNDRYIMGRYRERSAESMAEEIAYHVKNNKIKEFAINDLQMNANVKRLDKFCDLIIKKKLGVKWTANMMPKQDMKMSLIKKIKKAGCTSVIFGVESGSDNVLKLMNRKFKVSDSERLLKYFTKGGPDVWVNFIIGYPGEEEEDFLKTVSFIKRNKDFIKKVSVINKCNIVQNSILSQEADKWGILFPEKKEYAEVRWTATNGNCELLRDLRLQKLIMLLDKLNIPTLQSNVKYSDPLLSDEKLAGILGKGCAFSRDSLNVLVTEKKSNQGRLVNSFLKTINEIVNYKEEQICEVIKYKHQEVKKIVKEHKEEKEKIAAKYDNKIKSLVAEYADREKKLVEVKDKEIRELTRTYMDDQKKMVAESDLRIKQIVEKKDQEFEHKFEKLKKDMQLNINRKDDELLRSELKRQAEVKQIIQMKDEEIKDISKEHILEIEQIVKDKDQEISSLNEKYKNLLVEREIENQEITKKLDQLCNSRWFKLRRFIRHYFKI